MPIRSHSEGFDEYRRERRRMQAKMGPGAAPLGYENQALRELELVEAREVRDQQLTREVHDFFAAATRQAASIVERVSREAQEQAGVRVEREMEAFLIDALARMNTFVVTVLQSRRNGQIAQAEMEPKVANLVGQMLDEFRWAGTAEVLDKHIGQDPFATAVEDVQREFRQQVGGGPADGGEPAPIEDHLVAAVKAEEAPPAADVEPRVSATELASAPAPAPAKTAPAPVPGKTAAAAPAKAVAGAPAKAAADATEGTEAPAANGGSDAELDRFKNALKALVRQGVMSREEAAAAWQARLKKLGAAGEAP
jgi:hypothetical protein